ncbi:pre-peptidase C-terminal domain-containing protein [Tautonia rosea]|uniref:pre-peptidase C-terminal domain-containing protein n=1 Tax=Tautonia rosea TaxID=2728037 RepID=UPI00160147EC|nr:pre-peptidase C-terminal domain-containing protein [Tautonia rosea]
MLSTISESGGVGGTSKTLTLPSSLNLVEFSWENYSIPDEFQILHGSQRIAGNVGLQSGGASGRTVVAARSSNDQLSIKVTAPREGTAWDFTVQVMPVELKVDAKLGDVTKVSIDWLFRTTTGQTLDSVGLDPTTFQFVSTTNARGKVAQVDNWQDELKRGVFYFVPTVSGTPLPYGQSHTNDAGLGTSELYIRGTITDPSDSSVSSREIEIPVVFNVTAGFSTSFPDPELRQTIPAVDGAGTTRLDIFRQQQRLAYLGYPGGSAGNPLIVDGNSGGNTEWAKKLYSIVLDPKITGRGNVQNPASGTQYFKSHINSANAPFWRDLRGIPGLTFPPGQNQSQRFYGSDIAANMIVAAQGNPARPLISNGVAQKSGVGSPSKSHDGGRGVDLLPWYGQGRYFFEDQQGLVLASSSGGGGFIYKNASGQWQGGGQFGNPTHVNNGLQSTFLVSQSSGALVSSLENAGLLSYRQERHVIEGLLQAFLNAGAPRILYNDPRFFTPTGPIIYNASGAVNHANHVHIDVPGLVSGNIPLATQSLSILASGNFAGLASSQLLSVPSLSTAIDLGRLEATQTVSGTLDVGEPERFYRFQIGDVGEYGATFDTLRDLSVMINGLSDDADLELIVDPNDDGEGWVLFSSETAGTAAEVIDAPELGSGVYYVRVFQKAGDTDFNLTLSLAPLPVPSDTAGETVATAADLGPLNGTVSRSDFVGEVDPEDLYTFELTAVSELVVTLDGLDQGDLALALGRDTNGDGILSPDEVIASSDEEANAAESIHRRWLPAGNYLLQVLRMSGNSDYMLQATATPSSVPVDQAGNSIATAFDLGPLSAPISLSGFVGEIDPVDLYKFTVSTRTGLRIDLTGLSADADLWLFNATNGDVSFGPEAVLARSTNPGDSDESITLTGLAPGTYVLRVNQFEGDTDYDLSITPQAVSGADLVVTRTDSPLPADLGSQYTYSLRVTNNGPDTATNVRLTETIPSGLSRVRVTLSIPGGFIQNIPGGFVGNIPSLAPGESVSIDVTVQSFIAGLLPSTTTVTSDTPDFDLSNNSLIELKRVNTITSPPADLELSQVVSNLNPDLGDPITITLSLTNKGPGTATDIQIRNLLPAGLEFVNSSTVPGSSFDPSSGIWIVGNMQPNETLQLQITAKVQAAQTLTNTAEVIAVAENDPDLANNVTTISLQVGPIVTMGPQITGLQRFGYAQSQTTFVLSFDQEMAADHATDLGNYRLVDAGRDGRFATRDDRTILLRSAEYNPSERTVTLFPTRRISPHRQLLLIVNGTTDSGLTDLANNRLAGNGDGQPGSDYTGVIRGFVGAPYQTRNAPSTDAMRHFIWGFSQDHPIVPRNLIRHPNFTIDDLRQLRLQRRPLPLTFLQTQRPAFLK